MLLSSRFLGVDTSSDFRYLPSQGHRLTALQLCHDRHGSDLVRKSRSAVAKFLCVNRFQAPKGVSVDGEDDDPWAFV